MAHRLAPQDNASLSDAVMAIGARHRHWAVWLVPTIYAGSIAAFVTDLMSADTLAFGVFYAPLIATAAFHRHRRAIWVLTIVACTMNVIGSFIPDIAKDVWGMIENRAVSTLALLATAAFTWHARSIQERLAEQTERAEAAERIKTEVLDNLSQEIRAPLHAMIGILELVAADSRADQRPALETVRGAGRRLAMMVDNLVDLTQFDATSIPAERINLGSLLRQTAEAKRPDASARQISLTINIPATSDTMVQANSWAARRILENKIADAITYTAPGGQIEVSTDTQPDACSAVIATTSTWPPGAYRSTSDSPGAVLTPSVMGLALSQRLAQAMNAALVVSNGPGEGTTVRLRLPTVVRPEPKPADRLLQNDAAPSAAT
jgi:signal transduction histidine kinase